ncbi:MAG: MFS transporter [Sphaerochaetaceae bacterium]|nr:MFS transporter [Sphaerochaetaceae bacterium]
MEINAKQDVRKVKTRNILAYGCGDFFGGGSFLIISTLFMVFLTNVAKIPPQYAAIVVLVGKGWDAISDPLFGILSDKTKSRFGRRRIYFLIGIVPVIISYALLWNSFQFNSLAIKVIYYTFTYALFSTVYTMVMVPYNALVSEMSVEYKTRARLSGSKMAFSQFSALIAGTIPGYLVNNVYSDNPEMGFRVVGLVFGVLYAIPWLFVFLGTFEQENIPHEVSTLSLRESLKELKSLLSNKTFKVHIEMYLLAYIAMDILSTSFIYYATYYLFKADYFYYFLGTFLLSQLCALGFYIYFSNKKGKAVAYRLGAAIIIADMILFTILLRPSSQTLLIIILCIVMGIGFSAIISMPWAMLPESCDVEILCHGKDRSGAVSGMFTLIRKLTQALVLWIFGNVLAIVGFDANLTQQTPLTVNTIRIMFSIIPLVLMIFGFLSSRKYKVNPQTFKVAREEIERIQNGGKKEDINEENRKIIEELTGHTYS